MLQHLAQKPQQLKFELCAAVKPRNCIIEFHISMTASYICKSWYTHMYVLRTYNVQYVVMWYAFSMKCEMCFCYTYTICKQLCLIVVVLDLRLLLMQQQQQWFLFLLLWLFPFLLWFWMTESSFRVTTIFCCSSRHQLTRSALLRKYAGTWHRRTSHTHALVAESYGWCVWFCIRNELCVLIK